MCQFAVALKIEPLWRRRRRLIIYLIYELSRAHVGKSSRNMIFQFRFSFQTLSITHSLTHAQCHRSGTIKILLISLSRARDVWCVYSALNATLVFALFWCGRTELRISVWDWKSDTFRASPHSPSSPARQWECALANFHFSIFNIYYLRSYSLIKLWFLAWNAMSTKLPLYQPTAALNCCFLHLLLLLLHHSIETNGTNKRSCANLLHLTFKPFANYSYIVEHRRSSLVCRVSPVESAAADNARKKQQRQSVHTIMDSCVYRLCRSPSFSLIHSHEKRSWHTSDRECLAAVSRC